MKKLALIALPFLALVPKTAFAHCPLCTVGAGALAVFAAYLGISSIIVGVLIGAFALALGAWLAPLIKRRYIPYQKEVLTLLIYLSTVVPVMPLIRDYGPFYISLGGEYGTPFNKTYVVDLFLFGAILGGLLVAVAPWLSRALTRARGEQLPFQGMAITLGLLLIASVIIQVLVW
ncbi:MAG: hypothetical protein NUV59_03825 [Patescibacteria group bacterium]|nr:hypothetical protein [Patescibacteria group bacterium]